MKKILSVLAITFVLTIALLAPASAATSADDHAHIMCLSGTQPIGCEYVNPTYHYYVFVDIYTCSLCGDRRFGDTYNGPLKPHNDGFYCTLCNHTVQMSIPGEETMAATEQQ